MRRHILSSRRGGPIVAECNSCEPFALCFHPHFQWATLFGDSVHYEIRLISGSTKEALQSSERSLFLSARPSPYAQSPLEIASSWCS
jgi:hypothetical protein